MLETRGPHETEAAGGRVAAALAPGDVVLVLGELGAGKSTFVRGACRALGVRAPVTSPTFAIAHRYPADGGAASPMSTSTGSRALPPRTRSCSRTTLASDTITFVEWPAAGAAELPAARMIVSLTHLGGDRRRIEVSG